MAFSTLSSEAFINSSTILDNMFITEFLPYADETAIKVYLYSLMQCSNRTGNDNSAESISLALGITKKQLLDAVKYWESVNAIKILSEDPLKIEFIPLKTTSGKIKKYNPEKYQEFICQIEQLILARSLTPNELIKFVETIEDYKISTDAMLMIAKYCVSLKGENIHTNYILTVAKTWANEGVKTVEQVDNKLKEMEANSDSMRQVYYALGLKSTPDFEDKQYYIKWTTSWGYDLESILYTAKLCKKRGGIKKLDAFLDEFYKLGLFTLADIKTHSEYIEYIRNLAININKTIGVYYENVDTIVEQYITPWLNKGYEAVGLKMIATYCLKHTIKNLEGMDNLINNLFAKGIVTDNAILEYFNNEKQTDKKIKHILSLLGTSRMVIDSDRIFYKTWTDSWGMTDEIIEYGASLAFGKSGSFAYLNNLIATFKENNAKTVDDCKKIPLYPTKTDTKQANSNGLSDKHIYSKEELDNLFNKEDESVFDF